MEKIKGFLLINDSKIFNSNEKMDVINPSNEKIIARVPIADIEQIETAAKSAYESFLHWSEEEPKIRSKILNNIAEKVRKESNRISRILTLEQGKPLKEAKSEVNTAAEIIDFYAEESKRIKGINYWINSNSIKSQVIYQPIGVIGAITPFNYPVILTAFKVAPALAVGNTVIVKPSSLTPLSVCEFLNCFLETGLPKGSISCLIGPGKKIINYLMENAFIKKISFTGSTATGRKIMSLAGNYLKKLTFELGGNSPVVVFKDVDLEKAVSDIVYRTFRNMGQVCNSINRIYVEDSILKDFVKLFISKTKGLNIDDGIRNPEADLGPMVSMEAIKKTEDHIADAIEKGASLEYGGKKPKKFKKGFFFEPTVITNVNHQMKVMNEETFGPIAPIMGFKDIDTALKLANDSKYGLVSYVYTKDLSKAIFLSEKLHFGTVNINNIIGAEIGYPYCGWKDSGIGIEVSEHAMYEYLLLKHIRIRL